MNAPVIHWFRRDLRIQDNTALYHALRSDAPVIPLFILDPYLLTSPYTGLARLNSLFHALLALDDSLQQFGTRLLIRSGSPLEVLAQLTQQVGAAAIYANADYSPYAKRRENRIHSALAIPIYEYDDALLLPPGSILKADGTPYTVFTPFWKNWQQQPKPHLWQYSPNPDQFFNTVGLVSDTLPAAAKPDLDMRESGAQKMLDSFIETDINEYDEKRNWLPIHPFAAPRPAGTSYLSPYLRLGLISPRQAYWAARTAYSSATNPLHHKSIEGWVRELAWREFYAHILYHFPHVLQRDFVNTYQSLEWRHAPEELEAWKAGMTGYPIVDAAMRQLQTVGWLPNRARMIVASFLTKDLLIHWKEGEIYFMQHLIDGDPASNNGGWQWTAGTGTDAQPYFRIFNPVSQSRKFATPQYIRHWVPELRDVPDEFIHEPWLRSMPPRQYPQPIVDHAFARERTLQAFTLARGE